MRALTALAQDSAVAWMFMTRVPLPGHWPYDPARLPRAAHFFPAIGLIVGAICAGVLAALSPYLGTPLASLASLLAGVLLTGAMHEDGLADVADGLFGGTNRERKLEIMRDSRVGAFGVLALVFTCAARWQLLSALSAHSLTTACGALICAHALGRYSALVLMATLPYARAEGPSKARDWFGQYSTLILCLWAVTLALLAWVVGGQKLWYISLPAFAVIAACFRWFRKELGGVTGDCLGASVLLTEIVFYTALVAALKIATP